MTEVIVLQLYIYGTDVIDFMVLGHFGVFGLDRKNGGMSHLVKGSVHSESTDTDISSLPDNAVRTRLAQRQGRPETSV